MTHETFYDEADDIGQIFGVKKIAHGARQVFINFVRFGGILVLSDGRGL